MSLNRLKELVGITQVTEDKVNFDELVDKFLNDNKLYSFEGPSGLRKFIQFVKILDPKYNTIEAFLEDNPGAFEALLNFIINSNIEEWIDNLKAELHK